MPTFINDNGYEQSAYFEWAHNMPSTRRCDACGDGLRCIAEENGDDYMCGENDHENCTHDISKGIVWTKEVLDCLKYEAFTNPSKWKVISDDER